MTELKVKITYPLEEDHPKMLIIDSHIKNMMAKLNAEWIGQGFDTIKEIRDINFIIKIDEKL